MKRRLPKYDYDPQTAQVWDPQRVMDTIDMVGRTLPGMNDTLLEMNRNVSEMYGWVQEMHGIVTARNQNL